jgi:lipid-binding SYLF domain-containing protein
MNTEKWLDGLGSVGLVFGAILLSMAMVFGFSAPTSAVDDKQEAEELVEKARMTFDNLVTDPKMGALVDLMKGAKGVFICPALLKGAVAIGASGGDGVFLARDEKTRDWNGPAFYAIGGASFGLQIGGHSSEVVLVAMTERGVISLLSTSSWLIADAAITAGPIGVGASAGTANLSADILSFSRAKGLYGGLSLDGAIVATRASLNDAYYSKPVRPSDILIRGGAKNPHASALIEVVRRTAEK